MVEIDSESLFNGAAAVLGTAAVVFFVTNVDLGFSPVAEIGLVVVFLAGVFVLTQVSDDPQLVLLGYALIVTSSVALFFDVVDQFGVNEAGIVVGLLLLSSALFVLRYRLDRDHRFVSPRTARATLGVVAVSTAVVLVVDVGTGGLVYGIQTQPEVEVAAGGDDEVAVATVRAHNPTPLPERVETPDVDVCAAGNWSRYRPVTEPDEPPREVRLHATVRGGYNEVVLGFGTETYPVTVHLDRDRFRGETFPVRRTASCPSAGTGRAYIAVFERSDGARRSVLTVAPAPVRSDPAVADRESTKGFVPSPRTDR